MENYNLPININDVLSTYMISNEIKYENENTVIRKFQISSQENTVVYFEGITSPSAFEKMIDGLDAIEIASLKEKLLKTAFKNRTKQYNFSQLICNLLENNISESDFENEVEAHPDFYAISLPEKPIKISDLDVLTSLIAELKEDKLLDDDISVDEVSELFEVNLDDVTTRIAQLKLIE